MIQNANTSIYQTHAYTHFTMDRQQTVCCTNFFLILLKNSILLFKSMHMDDTRVQIYVRLSLILPVPTMDLNIFETFQNLITFESLHIEYWLLWSVCFFINYLFCNFEHFWSETIGNKFSFLHSFSSFYNKIDNITRNKL